MKQCFYLVCKQHDNDCFILPLKISLQEDDAVKFGRTLATKDKNEGIDSNYALYSQEITRSGRVRCCRTLEPFKSLNCPEIKSLRSVTIPDGMYRGELGGHSFKIYSETGVLLETTRVKIGVKGFGLKVKVKVEDSFAHVTEFL